MIGNMLRQVACFFLAFSHDTIIIPVSIIGYIWLDKKAFFHAICLVLLSMLFNFALKTTFQVPLAPTLGKEGFAFPSGHMQASIVFYGWIFCNTYRFLASILLIVLLVGIGISLLYLGYHNYLDILGALFFGIALMRIYYLWVFRKAREVVLLQAVLSIIAAGTFLIFYCKCIYNVAKHLWMAYYAIIGITFAEYYFKSNPVLPNRKTKIVATVFCFISLYIVVIMAHQLPSFIWLPVYMVELQWLVIGFVIPLSCYVGSLWKGRSS